MRGQAETMEAAKLAAAETTDKLLDALMEQFHENARQPDHR